MCGKFLPLFWTIFGLVAAPCLASAASVADFSDFSLSISGSVVLPGRLFVPPEAAATPSIPRPFITFLHGAGENGSNNLSQIDGNIDNLLAEAKRRGAYLYAPQTASNWSSATTTGRVMTMIDRALAEQNVDNTRQYITGLSNGGGGTWNMLSRYPERFAAGVPICGVTPASDFVPANFLNQSIAAFHARDDTVVSVATSHNVVNSILAAAGEPLPAYPPARDNINDFVFEATKVDLAYIEFAVGGHGIWGPIYNAPPLYDWLFAHTTAVPEPSALVALVAGIFMLTAMV